MLRLPAFTSLLAAFLLLAGCRTYGGYDTEAQTYDEIVEAVRVFAAELDRARAEYDVLSGAAERSPLLLPYATRYAALLQAHEVVLEEHRAMAAELEGEDDYRTLNRALGAIVVTQETTRRHYLQLFERALEETSPPYLVTKEYNFQSRYVLVPPYYDRLRYDRSAPSLEAVLAGAGVARDAGSAGPASVGGGTGSDGDAQ